jgi:hypothetical protein
MVALLDTAGRVDLELESFEKIPAGDHYSLFRVDGRWVLAPGVDAPTPALVVQRGARRDRFEPLPGGADDFREDDGRAWSAGYAVPLDLILDARVRFWLEADGPRYPLGSPEDRELYEGREAQVVVRNGRPHLLLAAGLMAVAISPLVGVAPANAQAPATGPTGPTGPTGTVDPVGTTGPTGPSGAAAPVAAPAVTVEGVAPTAKKHANRAERRAHAKAKAKAKHHTHKHRRTAAPAKQVTTTVRASLDPTPHVTPTPSPLQQSFAVPPFLLPIY